MTAAASLAPLLERFFSQRLMQERRVSPHTISSYRDTFRLFLKFTQPAQASLSAGVRADRCTFDRELSGSPREATPAERAQP
jgi:site-specific recombinase XerC